jgi:ketosteroid isomerase-like protein
MTQSESRTAPAAFDIAAMKRAIEGRDAEALIDLYAEDAEMEIVDRDRPPSAPMRLVGRKAIETHLRDVCGRAMTHSISDEVAGNGRAAFVERCAYPDGCNVVAAMTLQTRDGRIVRHLTVQAWDNVS